ncbi:hypothetical protein B296_00047065 [Ensete ventricosum]|uniref:Uncharacterized protein n=1 Tax=Ensete ventricosum TaxID=4639 RepID=A0A426XB96_ENSVE|nr:hypothetical protein B296_00047065 [Ensete ventricosum]
MIVDRRHKLFCFYCTTEEDVGDAERRGKKLSLDSGGLPSTEERQARVTAAKSTGGVGNTWWVPLFGWSLKPNYIDGLATQEASRKGDRYETKGKSRRPTDLKGRVVEEGEAEAGEARGDAVGVSMTGPRNDCFETGDMSAANDERDPNIWILEGETEVATL